MIDYSYLYKEKLSVDGDWHNLSWDFFISAYSLDERTHYVFDKVEAKKKFWLIFPEYNITPEDYPKGANSFSSKSNDEAQYLLEFIRHVDFFSTDTRYCIDATGFLPHYLIFLLKLFNFYKVKSFDILYSEPSRYAKRELTRFSDEVVVGVRQLKGFEGNHKINTINDLLIINSGYDHKLISNAAEHKGHARKIQLLGFPPLRADMYQENIIRSYKAEESVGNREHDEHSILLAPANDPFETANVLKNYITQANTSGNEITNLYLCPLGTKPQLIGMTIYYLYEHVNQPTSIIYPFCRSYPAKTSVGISNIWKYTIEFS